MPKHGHRKLLHFFSTAWFVLCVGLILITSLRQAGVHWWILFSVSGYGVVVLLLLISLYLFAIFKGISSSQTLQIEHPLTSTSYYASFYNLTPFLGGLAGLLGTIGISGSIQELLSGISLGTLAMTFLSWVVVDPVVGVLETIFSESARRHRQQRLADEKAEAIKKQLEKKRLLDEVFKKEQLSIQCWQEHLTPKAKRLAELMTKECVNPTEAEREAIGIGAIAWQIGGIGCMQVLRDMALDFAREKASGREIVDYVSFWWDGVGSWQRPVV